MGETLPADVLRTNDLCHEEDAMSPMLDHDPLQERVPTNQELAHELDQVKKQNNSLQQQIQALTSRAARLERDLNALAAKRHL
jgi:hypothetical protein